MAPLFVEDEFVVVRADAVRLVIEAKSGVDRDTFNVAVNNIRAAKSLDPRIGGAIFGLTGPKRKDTVKDWLTDIATNGVPDSASDTGVSSVPAEHLANFVHFASGLQVMAQWRPNNGDAIVTANESDKAGQALLWFWHWILQTSRLDPRPDARVAPPHLLEYLRLPEPDWPELICYPGGNA